MPDQLAEIIDDFASAPKDVVLEMLLEYSDAVPPLRLSARRRRSFSLAHGGGERMGAPAWRRWFAPAASAALVIGVIAGSVTVSRLVLGGEAPDGKGAAAPTNLPAWNTAAAWVSIRSTSAGPAAA